MFGGNNDDKNNNDKENSGSGSNNLLDKELQDVLRDRRDEQLLFARFKNVALTSLENLSRQLDSSNNDGEGKLFMGDEEKKIISNMNGMGLKEGIAAGIVTFIVLRRGPVYIGRWVRRRQMAQYQNNNNPSSTSPTPPPISSDGYKLKDPRMNTNPFQRAANNKQEFPRSGNIFVRSIWFMFDVTLSLMMAASVSVAFTDTDEIRQQVIDMPLVQGRSLIADALCEPIIKELVKVKEEKDPAYERLTKLNKKGQQTPASYNLEGIQEFCKNCERRRYVEHRLRQERGLAPKTPVEIPSPGVARHDPRLIEDENGQEKVIKYDDTEEPFTEQFNDDTSWTTGFVNDKEDGNKRNW